MASRLYAAHARCNGWPSVTLRRGGTQCNGTLITPVRFTSRSFRAGLFRAPRSTLLRRSALLFRNVTQRALVLEQPPLSF